MYLSPAGTDLNPRQSLERRWPATSWTSASRLLRPRLRWTATPRALACPSPPCFPRFHVAVDSAFHSQAPDPKEGTERCLRQSSTYTSFSSDLEKMSQEWLVGGNPHTVNMIWRGRGEARKTPGGVGTQLEIPGLAARPSGHPGPRRRPPDSSWVSPRASQSAVYYFLQSIDNVRDSGNPGALVCNQHIYSQGGGGPN